MVEQTLTVMSLASEAFYNCGIISVNCGDIIRLTQSYASVTFAAVAVGSKIYTANSNYRAAAAFPRRPLRPVKDSSQRTAGPIMRPYTQFYLQKKITLVCFGSSREKTIVR